MRRVFLIFLALSVTCSLLGVRESRAHAASMLPALTVGDVSVWEGNAGSVTIVVPLDLSSPAASTVTVHYVVGGGTATAGSDYAAVSGKKTFLAGESSKKIQVKVFGDTVPEGDEYVHVTLSNASTNATIAKSVGNVTILDDDNAAAQYAVALGGATVTEADAGSHYVYVPVTLSVPATSTVKIEVTFDCGTSNASIDYGSTPSKILTFLAGQRMKTLTFKVTADYTPEAIEAFWEKLTVKVGGVIASAPTGMVTVVDNDGGSSSSTPVGGIDRVSIATDGSEANVIDSAPCSAATGSLAEAASPDGRYVVFQSAATNLVGNDTNGTFDMFLRDRQNDTTERIDKTNSGQQLSQGTNNPQSAISDDGRYVMFGSSSPEIAPTGTTGAVFVRDRSTDSNDLVSVLPDGTLPTNAIPTGMNADGRYVAFMANGQLYVRDRTSATTQSVASITGWFWTPMSADGTQIAFVSADATLVPNDTNGYPDVFVRNLQTGTTERVNILPNGLPDTASPWNVNATKPAMSRDGRYVAFWSWDNSVPDTNIYVRDRLTQTTQQANVGITPPTPDQTNCFVNGGSISGDGQKVVFEYHCEGADFVTRPTDLEGIFEHDLATNATFRVDTTPDGSLPDSDPRFSENGFISGDGSYLIWDSFATNLVPNDTNDARDVFAKRLS